MSESPSLPCNKIIDGGEIRWRGKLTHAQELEADNKHSKTRRQIAEEVAFM
jgi:hypothetical protein